MLRSATSTARGWCATIPAGSGCSSNAAAGRHRWQPSARFEYAFDVLKADGVGLLTSYGSRYPGNPHFEPVCRSSIGARRSYSCIPTWRPAAAGILPDVPGPTIEYQFNTARAITNLLYTGTLTRYPDIRTSSATPAAP